MKERIRRSSIKPKRKHGYRAKPYSYRARRRKIKPHGSRRSR